MATLNPLFYCCWTAGLYLWETAGGCPISLAPLGWLSSKLQPHCLGAGRGLLCWCVGPPIWLHWRSLSKCIPFIHAELHGLSLCQLTSIHTDPTWLDTFSFLSFVCCCWYCCAIAQLALLHLSLQWLTGLHSKLDQSTPLIGPPVSLDLMLFTPEEGPFSLLAFFVHLFFFLFWACEGNSPLGTQSLF